MTDARMASFAFQSMGGRTAVMCWFDRGGKRYSGAVIDPPSETGACEFMMACVDLTHRLLTNRNADWPENGARPLVEHVPGYDVCLLVMDEWTTKAMGAALK